MTAARCGPVTGTEGNVIYCNFGDGVDAGRGGAAADEALAGVRAAITEINSAVSETLAVHTAASALERDAAQLLLKALDSMDIVAFQSRILLAGADRQRDAGAGCAAASLWRFVSAGKAVSERLHALAREHRSWIGAEERILQEIAAQAGELESTAGACINAMRADTRGSGPSC